MKKTSPMVKSQDRRSSQKNYNGGDLTSDVYVGQYSNFDFTGVVENTRYYANGNVMVVTGQYSDGAFNGPGSFVVNYAQEDEYGMYKQDGDGTYLNGKLIKGTMTNYFSNGDKAVWIGQWGAEGNWIEGSGSWTRYDADGNQVGSGTK